MPVSTQNQLQVRVGVSLQDKKYTEEILLCNILEKYSQPKAKKEREESSNTVVQHALI